MQPRCVDGPKDEGHGQFVYRYCNDKCIQAPRYTRIKLVWGGAESGSRDKALEGCSDQFAPNFAHYVNFGGMSLEEVRS